MNLLTSLSNSLKWGLIAIIMALLTIAALGKPVGHDGDGKADAKKAQEAYQLGRNAVERHQYAVARNLFKISLQHDADNAAVWRDLGACYLKLHEAGSAYDMLKQALKLNNGDAFAHDLMAVACQDLDKDNLALKHSRTALELARSNVDILANHAALLTRLDKDAEAATVFVRALELDPKHQAALAGYGSLLCKMGYYKEAIGPLERVNFGSPSLLPARYNLSLAYYRSHHYNEAILEATQIINQKKDHANAYQLRGQCYFELRNAEAACKDFNMARQLGNKDALAYYKLNCLGNNMP